MVVTLIKAVEDWTMPALGFERHFAKCLCEEPAEKVTLRRLEAFMQIAKVVFVRARWMGCKQNLFRVNHVGLSIRYSQ